MNVHRHLFQDVYGWAGKVRTVRTFKDGNAFCYPEHIDRELKELFGRLKDQSYLRGLDQATFAKRAAVFLGYLNAIHPFREGNGRTQNVFLALLAARAGHPLNFGLMDPAAFLRAMIQSFTGHLDELERQIAEMIA